MPGAPEYEFIPTDGDALAAALAAGYERIVGTAVRPGSKERLFIAWMASILLQERAIANRAANQNLPSRARGADLDALAELFYAQERPAAQPASCRIRFEISEARDFDVLIPRGTRVTDAGAALYWETVEELRVRAGETAAEGGAVCQTAGTVGNGCAAGQISKLVDVFDYYKSCANVTESGGGSDAPDDDAFYDLLRLSMDALSSAGPAGAYIYHAKKVSAEIGDVVANTPAPAQVCLYVLMRDGTIAGEAVKRKVLDACGDATIRPLTDLVSVEDPEVVDYEIRLTWYAPKDSGLSTVQLEKLVAEAAEAFRAWQSGKLGRDVNPSKLCQLLMGTGIKRVELEAPAFRKLRDGREKDVPQLARCVGVTLQNGGFEDE